MGLGRVGVEIVIEVGVITLGFGIEVEVMVEVERGWGQLGFGLPLGG